jgi:hypothetical protein
MLSAEPPSCAKSSTETRVKADREEGLARAKVKVVKEGKAGSL